MKIKKKWILVCLLPACLVFGFIYYYSIFQVIVTSFCEWRIGSSMQFKGLGNYRELFGSSDFWQVLYNNVIWILLQSTVHVVIGVTFALIVSRGKRYSGFFRTIYMLPNIISSAALGILFYNVFNPSYGIFNKILGLIEGKRVNINWFADIKWAFPTVTMTWLPFAAIVSILVIAELSAVDTSIYEAAQIDGANESQMIRYIKLPMARNAIGTGSILGATSMLQKFDIITLTSNGGPGYRTTNLPLMIYKTAFNNNNLGLANAQGVILILIGLVSIFVINKAYRMNEPV